MSITRRTLRLAAGTTATAATVLMTSALLSPAPAHADSSTKSINLASTRTAPDATFVWQGNATSTAGQFCVRVNDVNVVAGASIDTGDEANFITVSASYNKPACKYISIPAGQSYTAYGIARNPGKDTDYTGYYSITQG